MNPSDLGAVTGFPHAKYERLIARTCDMPPIPAVVAHPCDKTSCTVAALYAHARRRAAAG